MKVGIIGLGSAGAVHLEAWQSVDAIQLTAAADPSPAMQRRARAAGLRAYEDPLDMISREELDAVSICTPPASHAALTVACLEQGLHVLCEKPLATTISGALKMLRTATRARRHLLLATKFRHVPDLVAARELINDGAIGEPVAFEVDFSSMVDMSQRWNSRRALAGGGVIIDNGCHAFDLVAFLFGTVTRVQATRYKQLQNIGVEDSATILVAAGRGLIGRIDISWSLATGRETYVIIHGSQGTIEVGWRRSRLRIPGKPPRRIGAGYNKLDAHRRMLTNFAEIVTGVARPWIGAGECLRAVAAVDAAYRSLHLGEWVHVDMMQMRNGRVGIKARA